MDIDLNLVMEKLTQTFQNAKIYTNIIENYINTLCENLDLDVLIVDKEANILFEKVKTEYSFTVKNELTNDIKLETQINKQLESINEIKINITLDNLYTTKYDRKELASMYGNFIPIYMYRERLATIILYGENMYEYNKMRVLSNNISIVLSILIWNEKNNEKTETIRKREDIKICIASLSYSELVAIINIFDELQKDDGLIVASKIADKAGITRSVIVNALRKFESARIIETRSLGMKGTYIKILNDYLPIELKKFKK